MLAAHGGYSGAVRLLLEYGADLSLKSESGLTAEALSCGGLILSMLRATREAQELKQASDPDGVCDRVVHHRKL